ncbi:MAG: glutathione S-transferase family protein [Polyangiaceae bacterium]
MTAVKAYISSVSPTCKRVFAALHYKDIPHERIEIDISKKHHERPTEFQRISPHGKVPAIEHDGTVVYESTVINEYFEEVFPQRPMLPKEVGRRAYARDWIKYSDSQLQDLDASMVHGVREKDGKIKVCRQILSNLAVLDRELEGKQHYFLGEELSLVDAALAPTLRLVPLWSRLIGDEATWKQYKHVQAYLDRLAEHPSIAAAVNDTPMDVYEGFFGAVLVQGMTFP